MPTNPSKGPRTSNTQPVQLTMPPTGGKAPRKQLATKCARKSASNHVVLKVKHKTETKKKTIKKGGWAPLKATSSMKKSRATSSSIMLTTKPASSPVKWATLAKMTKQKTAKMHRAKASRMNLATKSARKSAPMPSTIFANISAFTSSSPNTDIARVMCPCGSKDGRPSWGGKCAWCRTMDNTKQPGVGTR